MNNTTQDNKEDFNNTTPYRVLALKYRPTSIKDLKGQDVLVTTLRNSFELNRISHAFMLTGVRGVGKTTTARIIAKALNCIGEDGKQGITLNPCGVCQHCIAISNDKDLDVLEMDAASKTGIDDIREIIETVAYKPVVARYKVYIIDEVHMLSKSAFNALLKTLEEPPPYVKFIFATTEIKKVPITVVSRCQRFDLRRLDVKELSEHLEGIAKKENVTFEKTAINLIAKAADGSVRDSLSILDQAISNSNANLTEENVSQMLGLNNKNSIHDLFENILKGNLDSCINAINDQYQKGSEMPSLLEDLLEFCHLLTMFKVAKNIASSLTMTKTEEEKAITLSEKLSLSTLVTFWQIMIKGLEEVKQSSFPKKSLEMLLVRLIWANEVTTMPMLQEVLKNKNEEMVTTAPSPSNTQLNKKQAVENNDDTVVKSVKSIFPNATQITDETD